MTVFDYATTHDWRDKSMTSNLNHILDEEALAILKSIEVDGLERAFGDRPQDYQRGDYEYDVKGYTLPYWYFKAINGEVVGIGFRYGEPRAVGKNVTPERLSRFVKLVGQVIDNTQYGVA